MLAVNQAGLTQYFIGQFDGHSFKNDNPKDTVLYVDYGPDGYAGVTYNSAPDDRRIFMSWLNSGPTDPWRGIASLPREMRLVEVDGKVKMASLPVKELDTLRMVQPSSLDVHVKANTHENIPNVTTNLLNIDLTAVIKDRKPSDKIGIELRGAKDSLRVYFDDSFVIDRSKAGRDSNPGVRTAPRLTKSPILEMRIVLDVSTVELFADNGLTAMTALFYSEDKLNTNISVFYETSDKNSQTLIPIKLTVNQLKSVWH